MQTHLRSGLVIVLLSSMGVGCATSYEPARSPRIQTVMDGGQPTFVRDGVHFGSQVWGTGLVDAVQGNPRAEHHARVGRNLIAGGFTTTLVGLASEIGGLVVFAHDRKEQGNVPASGLSLGLVFGGLVAVLAGSAMISAGQPHVYDAINLYNDGLDAQPPAAASPLGPRRQEPAR
jgi:hypothetical protein